MQGGGFGAFLQQSNVVNYIKDLDFPCTKQDLINMAEDHHAPELVIKALEKLPDETFETLKQVVEHL